VTPIDTATDIPGQPIGVGETPELALATARTVYVLNQSSGTVTPISTATNKPGLAINLGKNVLPVAIAVTPPKRIRSIEYARHPVGTATSAVTRRALYGVPRGRRAGTRPKRDHH
jgi:DNA-binding beta-propeller fold protein YncE